MIATGMYDDDDHEIQRYTNLRYATVVALGESGLARHRAGWALTISIAALALQVYHMFAHHGWTIPFLK